MAQRRIALAKWTPDLAQLEIPGLRDARNCVPRAIGYGPMGSLLEIGDFGALVGAARCRGSIQILDSSGAPVNFAGTGTTLEIITSGAWTDVSKAGGYTLAAASRWEKEVYYSNSTGRKPLILYTCLDHPIQAYEVGTSALFANLAAAAPLARHIGVIASHVVVGNLIDATDGPVPNRIHYPAIGNASSWPPPGSTAATSAQSGFQTLVGNFGAITGVIGGSTWGAICQEKCINRADYVGGSRVFEVTRPETGRGLAVPGLAIPTTVGLLYFGGDGWWLFDGSKSDSVGKDGIDAWFTREFHQNFRDRVSWVIDPNLPVVHIGFTGIGNVDGQPNKVLSWNWLRGSWAHQDVEHDQLCLVVNPGPNRDMDRLPSPDPDMLTGSWDDIETASLVAGGFLPTHRIADFSGPALAAHFETSDLELNPGRRALMQFARPIVTRGTPRMAVAAMKLRSEADVAVPFGTSVGVDEDNKAILRADGRYHAVSLDLAAGWTGDALALDLDYTPTSLR